MQLSRSLLKIIDEAIIPGLLILAAKIIGLVAANYWYNLSWDGTASILPLMQYRSEQAFFTANTISNLFVLLVILCGFLAMLIRAHVLHGSHISPRLSTKLVQRQLTGLIIGSWELYHQAVVWLAYLWLALIIFGIHALLGVTPWWLPLAGTCVALIFTWLLIIDVEKEISLRKDLEVA